mgnify:CR=1 FL=1
MPNCWEGFNKKNPIIKLRNLNKVGENKSTLLKIYRIILLLLMIEKTKELAFLKQEIDNLEI